jgi:hypothetical protein
MLFAARLQALKLVSLPLTREEVIEPLVTASLFHIGVLARLAEQDILRRVEVLSCVSGGSIVGAHYYSELQHLLQTKADGEIEQKDYVELVKRIKGDFLAGVQTSIRCKVFVDILCNLRMFLQRGYTVHAPEGRTLRERNLCAYP